MISLLLASVILNVSPLRADDLIFNTGGQPLPAVEVVSLERLSDSPTMKEHQGEVIAAAEAKVDQMERDGAISADEKVQIKGWFKSLPFKRVVDVELSFLSGLPDMVGVCLEANPNIYLSIDACAGTMAFISSLSAHVSSRFLHYVNMKGDRGHEFSVGPSVGYRRMAVLGFDSGGGTAHGLDTLLSVEWVYWVSRYFGMGLQLDGGATFVVAQDQAASIRSVLPNAKLSLGLSF